MIPLEAIGKLVQWTMDEATRNGANSVSIPDEIVTVAAWLSGAAPQPQRAPLSDEQVFASEDFMTANGLYWGLPMETLMQIVRVTERAHKIGMAP